MSHGCPLLHLYSFQTMALSFDSQWWYSFRGFQQLEKIHTRVTSCASSIKRNFHIPCGSPLSQCAFIVSLMNPRDSRTFLKDLNTFFSPVTRCSASMQRRGALLTKSSPHSFSDKYLTTKPFLSTKPFFVDSTKYSLVVFVRKIHPAWWDYLFGMCGNFVSDIDFIH